MEAPELSEMQNKFQIKDKQKFMMPTNKKKRQTKIHDANQSRPSSRELRQN